LVLPPARRDAYEALAAVDERDRAPDATGHVARAVVVLRHLVAPALELLDGEVDPSGRAGEQPRLFEDGQSRDGDRTDACTWIRNAFRHADEHCVPGAREPRELPTFGDDHHASTG